MTQEQNPDGQPVNSDDALASFNKDLKDLQDKYSYRLIAVPVINPNGTIVGSLQVIDTNKVVLPEVVSPYTEEDTQEENEKK